MMMKNIILNENTGKLIIIDFEFIGKDNKKLGIGNEAFLRKIKVR